MTRHGAFTLLVIPPGDEAPIVVRRPRTRELITRSINYGCTRPIITKVTPSSTENLVMRSYHVIEQVL